MRSTLRWVTVSLGVGFWSLAYLYLTLPDVRVLAQTNPTTTAFIERRIEEAGDAGKTLKVRQQWISYRRISPQLKRAVLVAEDSAFWQHDGIDFEQIRESMEYNLERGEFARGASTITQQLAKNLYLSPSKDPLRKVRELMIARRLEAVLSKQRILEIYLNVIEWGDGIFGADAAARAYFGIGAGALGAEQSALLAGAIINPRVHSPGHPTPRLLRRQRMLLRRMGAASPPAATDEAPAAPASAPVTPSEPPPAAPPESQPVGGPPQPARGGPGAPGDGRGAPPGARS